MATRTEMIEVMAKLLRNEQAVIPRYEGSVITRDCSSYLPVKSRSLVLRDDNTRTFAITSIVTVLLFGLAVSLPAAAGVPTQTPAATSTLNDQEKYFSPPPEFAGQFGKYRSPLLFKNGDRVETAAEWPRRRAEILYDWTELMGRWPAVIQRPNMEVLRESRRESFTQKRVRLEIAPNQTGEGWLLIPDGATPKPAVLVVFYEPETSIGLNPKQPTCDFGLQLTRRGFVTLSIGTPGGDARKPDTGAAVSQPLSFHAYVAANCWQALSNLPEVDRNRIGVVGHSYGGKWSMFAGALWDKFAAVAVSDPGIVFDESRGNVIYWEPWYLGLDPSEKRPKPGIPTTDNPRTGAYKRMIEQDRDLHELHALIAPRPFFVSGGSEDPPSRWTALNHLVEVNRVLGFTNRVAMTNRENHTPNEDSNAQLFAFFEHFLAGVVPDKTPAILFSESFDDAQLQQRNWYDGNKFAISAAQLYAGKGCIEYKWNAGTTNPISSSGIRRLFEPTDSVYLRFYIKLSKGWGWTNRGYHPHLMHFMTTENQKYHGPAASHLTVYIEPWNGKLRIAATDIQNKDAPHGLTQGPLRGGYNGQMYDSEEVLFNDEKWHCVEAQFKLNSLDLRADRPIADGIVRGWFDGKMVIDRTDVVLRSTDFPKMRFNQYLLTPYFGPGLLPHEQTLWIDELAVGTKRIGLVATK